MLPAHIPPHKKNTTASAEHRQAMVEKVCKVYPFFQLDKRELLKSTPSYTVESIKDIQKEFPTQQLFFMIGMDSLINLTSWYQWEEYLKILPYRCEYTPRI